MPILFDFNPDTGVREWFDYDPITDQVCITAEQDVSGFLARMQAIRNSGFSDRKGAEEWRWYCSIPEVVELELRKRGLELGNKDHFKDILKIINSEYPYLKATDKWHR